jgi:hypothetical protein
MDDLIYFLLVIGWLAFSFYQQAAKKKKQAEQMRRTAEEGYDDNDADRYETDREYEGPETNASPQPDFKKVLEDLLMGNEIEIPETKPATASQKQEQADRKAEEEVNVYQKYLQKEVSSGPFITSDNIESLEERRAALENEMVVSENVNQEVDDYEQGIDFDLRKAVIYSEILNRRYAN